MNEKVRLNYSVKKFLLVSTTSGMLKIKPC